MPSAALFMPKMLKIHDECKSCRPFFVYQLRRFYFRIESDFCYGWVGNKKTAVPITTAGLGDSWWDCEEGLCDCLIVVVFIFDPWRNSQKDTSETGSPKENEFGLTLLPLCALHLDRFLLPHTWLFDFSRTCLMKFCSLQMC